MANPAIVPCAVGAWTLVAAAVSSARVYVQGVTGGPPPSQFRLTYRQTGAAAPTAADAGVLIPISDRDGALPSYRAEHSEPVDLYVWPVGAPGQAIVHQPMGGLPAETLGNLETLITAIVNAIATYGEPVVGTGPQVMEEARATQAPAAGNGTAVVPVNNLNAERVLAGFTWATQALSVEERNPPPTWGVPDSLVVTNLATVIGVDQHWYVNHSVHQHFSLQTIMSDGTATDQLSLTIWGSNQAGVAPGAITDWTNITLDVTGLAAVVNNAGAVNRADVADTSIQFEWIDYRYERTGGAGDNADMTLRLRRWY